MVRDDLQHSPGDYYPRQIGADCDEPSATHRLLTVMDETVPWHECMAYIMPIFRFSGSTKGSFTPDALLRVHMLRQWFGLGVEDTYDALIESSSMRAFARIRGVLDESALKDALQWFDESLDRHHLTLGLNGICTRALVHRGQLLQIGRRNQPQLQSTRILSENLIKLSKYFASIEPPYNLADIAGFNAIYRKIYPELRAAERQQAESYVEILIQCVEHPKYAAKIFGVV